ncbi:hypothetical protein NDI37_13600 [Funiculus sociatus GB2-A5]|uniref:Uncharacterized protein n=1 Tax=Funiculus sociatus GB2-A5 TaxID=2933946 RepID=A0ABV0JQ05_9CYAN|nr:MULTISPECIES: hypothetical protein [unclassified Trichocoleus]
MIADLLEDTRDYWRKLDELEAAYKKGEVSLQEVDAKVKLLMTELGRSRKQALSYFVSSFRAKWSQQPEIIVGVAVLGIITYAWAVVS